MTQAWIDERRKLLAESTPGPWEFRAGNDRNGDSVDLLMAEIGKAGGDEYPEYAEVFFGQELSAAEISANWELVRSARNDYAALLDIAEAAMDYANSEFHPSWCICVGCDETPNSLAVRLRAALERAR